MEVRPLGIAAAALCLGTVVAMDPAGWTPFGPSKWLAVSVLTLVTAAIALGDDRFAVDRRRTLLFGALVAVMAIAAVGGLDPWYAWIGTPERHLGVLGWALAGLAFVAGQQLRWRDRLVVATGVVGAGLIVGVYSLVEAIWREPIELSSTSDRLGGPFGSPAFLGAACALLLPAAIGVAADRRSGGRLRLAAVVAAVTSGVAAVGSGARAAWVALTVVAVVAGVAQLRRWRRGAGRDGGARVQRPVLVVVAALGAVVLTALVIGGFGTGIVEREHGATSRLDEWHLALQVIGDRPLLGAGPEGYRLAVPGNVDAGYERNYGRTAIPDRAHSGVLDVTATGGVVAGAIYVALLAMVAVTVWRALGRGDIRAGIAAGVGAYLLQQQLLFPLSELDPMAWMLAGAVTAWQVGGEAVDAPPARASTVHAVRIRRALGVGVGALALVALAAGVLEVAADRLDKEALVGGKQTNEALDLAGRAVDLRPDSVRSRFVLARVEQSAGTLTGVDRSLATIDDALEISPLDPSLRQERGLLLNLRVAITGDEADVASALQYWRSLVDVDPANARWQLELGRAAAAAGDVELARTAWTQAADLAPDDAAATTLLAALPPQ